ncbi:ABC1 kinase family protein [Algiphilus sp.]|uniref:ABC1 kinase family protein n=1 Tax=Algiphilus sp. TaxID=1872431 RepID=UPI003B522441
MSSRSRRLFWAGARTVGRSLTSRVRSLRDSDARQRFWQTTGEDWFALLSEMKGAAMKLGQLASQYEDLLPKDLSEALSKLQRSAPPRPLADLEPVMQAAWTAEQRARFVRIEEPAAAAASIGQVHRAHLDDGRVVALKLRYPEVREAIDDDVAALGRLFRMARIAPVDGRALDGVLSEIRTRFSEETDYRKELANLQRLRAARRHDYIVMPEPIADLCTESTLVTTWEEACSLSQAKQWSPELRDRIGEGFARWVVASVFDSGFVHADPHPGNFGFLADGRIVIYDFGCAVPVRQEARQWMAQAVAGGLDRDWPRVHAALQKLRAVPEDRALCDEDASLYADICRAVADPLLADATFAFRDGRIIDEARAVARSHLRSAFRYRPVPELVFVMRTLSGAYWLLRNLDAQVRMRTLLWAVARKAPPPPVSALDGRERLAEEIQL